MSRGVAGTTAAVAGLLGLLLIVAARPSGRAELVVRNNSFSTLSIAIVDAAGREVILGQAPPEFTNTLYFPADGRSVEVRFRARLRGEDALLHESDAVQARQGARLRWTLPDNLLEALRETAGRAPAEG